MPDDTTPQNNFGFNFGDLTKPACLLIEKVSGAVGLLYQPRQVIRLAQAETEANLIRVRGEVEVTDLRRRAFHRFAAEEERKQANIEAITGQALPELNDQANPSQIEDDWITNFFDKCRNISDADMQQLWAKVLASEANAPGKFSKRAISSLASLDKSDALLFTQLCGALWFMGAFVPLIYSVTDQIYLQEGLNYSSLKHLDDIGLINFDSLNGYVRNGLPQTFMTHYHGKRVSINTNNTPTSFNSGKVLLTRIGDQLASVCSPKEIPGFMDYVLQRWKEFGYIYQIV